MVVKYRLKEGSVPPSYQSEGASGADVSAFVEKSVILRPGERALIPTGIYAEVPRGYEIQVRPRSGNSINKGLGILNSPGTIDSDYRGEIRIIVINLSGDDVTVSNGDRIAQLVLCPVLRAEYVRAEELSDTDRGSGGFGSTGG